MAGGPTKLTETIDKSSNVRAKTPIRGLGSRAGMVFDLIMFDLCSHPRFCQFPGAPATLRPE